MADKKGRVEQHRLAFEKVRSMTRRGIEFEPFLVSSEAHQFDVSKFYADIFSVYTDDDGDIAVPGAADEDDPSFTRQPWNATTKFEDLEAAIGARETPMRVVFDVPLIVTPEVNGGLTMGVKGCVTTSFEGYI